MAKLSGNTLVVISESYYLLLPYCNQRSMKLLSVASQLLFRILISPFYSTFNIDNNIRLVNSRSLMSYYFYKESLGISPYEDGVLKIITKLPIKEGVILDIGANEGYYSLQFSSLFPQRKIYSIEPNPLAFSSLQNNISLNGVKSIVPLNLAASSSSNSCLHLHITSRYYQSLASVDGPLSNDSSSMFPVKSISVDDLASSSGHSFDIALIKIDVEGHEISVLKGAVNIISNSKPLILIECQEYKTLQYIYENLGNIYHIFQVKRNSLLPYPELVHPGMNLLLIPMNA